MALKESPLIQLSNHTLTPVPFPIPQKIPFLKVGNPRLIAFQFGEEGSFSESLDLTLDEEQYLLRITFAHGASCS